MYKQCVVVVVVNCNSLVSAKIIYIKLKLRVTQLKKRLVIVTVMFIQKFVRKTCRTQYHQSDKHSGRKQVGMTRHTIRHSCYNINLYYFSALCNMLSIAIYQLSFLVKFYQHLFNPITKLSHLCCFCCKITLSSAPSLKPAINVVIRQSQW